MDFGLPVTMASSRMSGPPRSSPPRSCPETGPTRRAGSRCYTSILLEFPIFLYGLLHLLAATFGIIILQVRCCSHISYHTSTSACIFRAPGILPFQPKRRSNYLLLAASEQQCLFLV